MTYQLTIAESNTTYDVVCAWCLSGCQADFLQYGKLVSVTPLVKGWLVTTDTATFSLIPNPALDDPLHADSTYTLIQH